MRLYPELQLAQIAAVSEEHSEPVAAFPFEQVHVFAWQDVPWTW
jgi:hypothetical protein